MRILIIASMSSSHVASKNSSHPERIKKYLTFLLGGEAYGIPVLKVREIIRMADITPVPRMPRYIKGVMNLRGKVIAVMDLRMKFELSQIEDTERTCTIVTDVRFMNGTCGLVGLIVDSVEEVVAIPEHDIEATPDFGSQLDTACILGIGKVGDEVKTLLDIDQILNSDISIEEEVAGFIL